MTHDYPSHPLAYTGPRCKALSYTNIVFGDLPPVSQLAYTCRPNVYVHSFNHLNFLQGVAVIGSYLQRAGYWVVSQCKPLILTMTDQALDVFLRVHVSPTRWSRKNVVNVQKTPVVYFNAFFSSTMTTDVGEKLWQLDIRRVFLECKTLKHAHGVRIKKKQNKQTLLCTRLRLP